MARIPTNLLNYLESAFTNRKMLNSSRKVDAHLMHVSYFPTTVYPIPILPISRKYHAAGVQFISLNIGENSTNICPFVCRSIHSISTRTLFLTYGLTDGQSRGRNTSLSWYICVDMSCCILITPTLFLFRPTIWKWVPMSRTDQMMYISSGRSYSSCH